MPEPTTDGVWIVEADGDEMGRFDNPDDADSMAAGWNTAYPHEPWFTVRHCQTKGSAMRPNRLQSAEGPEQVLYNQDGTRDYVLRQVGWIGASGDFYTLDEDPSLTERGGFAPLLFVAHSDSRVVSDA